MKLHKKLLVRETASVNRKLFFPAIDLGEMSFRRRKDKQLKARMVLWEREKKPSKDEL